MDFFFLAIYEVIVLIRPQELTWIPLLYGSRIILYSLFASVLGWVFTGMKNSLSAQTVMLALLLIIIVLSSALNGWLGGGLTVYAPKFAKTCLVPFMLFSSIVSTRNRHKVLMFIALISAILMVHNGIDQVNNGGVGWAGTKTVQGSRITYLGILNDPNDLGMFFVMTIPFAVYFMVRSGGLGKMIYFAAIGFIVFGIILTNSRGTMLGLIALCALWFLQKYSVKTALITGGLSGPMLMLFMSIFRKIDPNEGSAAGRWDAWYSGLNMLAHNPVFGVGYGGFLDHHELTAHNSYVLVFGELGLSGYFLWFSFLLLTFFMLYAIVTYKIPFFGKTSLALPDAAIHDDEIDDEIFLAKIMLFSMFGFAVTAFFLSRSYTFILFIYAGMSVACYFRAQKLIPDLEPITFKAYYPVLVKLMFGSIFFIFIFTRVMLHWGR